MAEPPLRIVVTGNSTGFFIRPPRRSPDEGTFAEVLESELLSRGLAADVTNTAAWMQTITLTLRDFERLVLHHQPRVVIVILGMFECQTVTMPTWTVRWLYRDNPRGGVNRAARDRLGHLLVRLYKRLTPVVLGRLPLPRRVPSKRFEQEFLVFVELIRKERAAEVFLLTIPPPSERISDVMRDIEDNVAEYNSIIRRVADAAGTGVHVVDTAAVFGAHLSRLLPDGLHFSVAGHRVMGLHLAGAVEQAIRAERH